MEHDPRGSWIDYLAEINPIGESMFHLKSQTDITNTQRVTEHGQI